MVDVNGIEHYVAEPQDVGNLIAVRKTLMSLTHDLDDKKMAVIQALTDEHNGVGAPGPNDGVQAPVQDIAEYIDEYAGISSLTEDQLRPILEQMANRFLMTIHEGEGEHGAHLYEYHGGSAFGHPNLDMYPEAFENVTDPIRKQHISATVREHKEMLSSTVVESDDVLGSTFDSDDSQQQPTPTQSSTDDESGTLSDFSDDDDPDDSEFSEVDETVAQRLREAVDDKRVTDLDDLPTFQHMLGISPIEYYQDDRGMPYVRAERPREDGDREDTIMDNDHPLWGDVSPEQVETRIENAIARLRSAGIFEVHDDHDKDGHKYITIDTID
jgi:hypothetical protein